jgi:translocator protein
VERVAAARARRAQIVGEVTRVPLQTKPATLPSARPHGWLRSSAALAGFGTLAAGAAALGARATGRPGLQPWYRALAKPPWQPPPSAFPAVWTTLYVLMSVSAWRVWRRDRGPARRGALRWWGVQLGLNAAWSPLFFGLRRPRTALVDAALLVLAVGQYARASRRVDRTAGWLVVPYLGWAAFAAALNAEIVRRNPRLA